MLVVSKQSKAGRLNQEQSTCLPRQLPNNQNHANKVENGGNQIWKQKRKLLKQPFILFFICFFVGKSAVAAIGLPGVIIFPMKKRIEQLKLLSFASTRICR